MNGWRRCGTYIYNGILLSHKKKWNWVICSEVDGPRVCHTELSKSEREKQIPRVCYTESSKSEREKQIPYDTTYMWNLKYGTNELLYKTETDSQT